MPVQIKEFSRLALLFLICSCLFFYAGTNVFSQAPDNIALTIAPPLVKNNMNPGETWKSAVKVVNNSNQPLDVYIQVADYKSGANGGPEFIQAQDQAQASTYALSQWIEVAPGPYNIEAQKFIEIPYSVVLPETADPGGHYAAILVGTKPIGDIKGSGIKISSLLASLIMLEVKGDILEQGQIREFTAGNTVQTEPDVKFNISFENTGNVHILPQGEINITNWLGKEKGNITINHATDYGNVLPKSIRQWDFEWKQDKSFLSMGRYKAELVLGYGNEARQTDSRATYFWLIYPKQLLIAIGSIFTVILLIFIFLKLYIRRAIIKTSQEAGLILPAGEKQKVKISVIPQEQNGDYHTTIKQRTVLKGVSPVKTARGYFRYLGIVLVFLIVISFVLYYFYFMNNKKEVIVNQTENKALVDDKASPQSEPVVEEEKTAVQPAADITASSAPAVLPPATNATSSEKTATTTGSVDLSKLNITVLNGTGIAGLGTGLKSKLENTGYKISKVGNAENDNYKDSLVSYRTGNELAAEALKKLLNGTAAVQADDKQTEDIIITIGSSYKQ